MEPDFPRQSLSNADQTALEDADILITAARPGQANLETTADTDLRERADTERIADSGPLSERHYTQIFESARDGILIVDFETAQITDANPSMEELSGFSRSELLGKEFCGIGALHDRDSIRRMFKKLQDGGSIGNEGLLLQTRQGEFRAVEFASSVFREGDHVAIQFNIRDISRRTTADDLAVDSEEHFRTLFETLTEGVLYQNSDGVLFNANPAAEHILGLSFEQMTGRVSSDPRWRAVREDGTDYPGEQHPPMIALQTGNPVIGVVMGVFNPRLDEMRWIRVSSVPQFRPSENRPYQVCSTLEDITEVRLAEIAREKAEAEVRDSHDRIVDILESVGDAFYAVDANLYLTYVNGKAENLWGRSRKELLGRHLYEAFPQAIGGLSFACHAQAISEQVPCHYEVLSVVSHRWMEVSIYPRDRGLSVYYRDVHDSKVADNVVRESEKRTHQVAELLQNALQPPLPNKIPGLQVRQFYKVGLTEEASVGGDFYDVYDIQDGCSVLTLGDLSGKGLAAAVQVSIVRNMLRAYLYSANALTDAVTKLNDTLANNGLLTGFCTLFVSTFDDNTKILRYVNCGQEPALLWRASTGIVDLLLPTGTVLGCFAGEVFGEREVKLLPGDAFAIYSDGLTEAGSSRETMLGTEGVSALFQVAAAAAFKARPADMAQALVSGLVDGVDLEANGGVPRDDVCLLVAIVEGIQD